MPAAISGGEAASGPVTSRVRAGVSFRVKRVLVIGSGGSGKTTFSKRLAARTGLPVIHLDQLYWHPGWLKTPDEEWDRLIEVLIARDVWIMDGNYGRTFSTRLAAADTIVFLDLPRVVCTWRIFKRQLRYFGRIRPDAAPGCPERLTWEFVSWVWTYPSRRRPGMLQRLERVRDRKTVIVLRSRAELERFLDQLPVPDSPAG
jgi:adenylate kinase family enzyme